MVILKLHMMSKLIIKHAIIKVVEEAINLMHRPSILPILNEVKVEVERESRASFYTKMHI